MIEDRNSKELPEAEEIKKNTQNSTKKKKFFLMTWVAMIVWSLT